ncbi:AmmeMemoRadiSam system radical SAM enzyme, partial [PVC group bacterium]|nr:AmmeMemoRadiSam system radical SAM enzyme [PVC group bacterium]
IGAGNLEPGLDTLKYLKQKTDVWFEINTLLIPGENDSAKEINEMSEWIMTELGPDVPLHFTAFHPDFRMMAHPNTPPATLTRARNIAMGKGLRYVFTGNVHDPEGGSTKCHACGQLLVERDWYELGEYHLENNLCSKCHASCAGRFDTHPGNWGARRQTVVLKHLS